MFQVPRLMPRESELSGFTLVSVAVMVPRDSDENWCVRAPFLVRVPVKVCVTVGPTGEGVMTGPLSQPAARTATGSHNSAVRILESMIDPRPNQCVGQQSSDDGRRKPV